MKGDYVVYKCPHCNQVLRLYIEPKEDKGVKVDIDTARAEQEEKEEYKKIAALNKGDTNVTVKAQVVALGSDKTGTNPQGKEWKLRTLTLKDDSGTIPLIVWDEEIDKVDHLLIDDWVIISAWKVDLYESKRGAVLQLLFGKFGKITKVG